MALDVEWGRLKEAPVLVTGGCGFIGASLGARFARAGADVTLFDRPGRRPKDPAVRDLGLHCVEGDPADATAICRHLSNDGLLVHCAGILDFSRPDVLAEREEAFLAASLKALHRAGTRRLVFASSCAVYGDAHAGQALRETDPLRGNSAYGSAKRRAEEAIAKQQAEQGIDALILRYFNAFGPAQHPAMVVPRFLALAVAGKPLTLGGGGHQVRDFLFIDDLAEATVRAAIAFDGLAPLNVGSGRGTTITDLAAAVLRVTRSSSSILTEPLAEDRSSREVSTSVADTRLLEQLTGFTPAYDLDTALRCMLERLPVADHVPVSNHV